MRSPSLVAAFLLGMFVACGPNGSAQATPLIYDFAFFKSDGTQVGSGFLSVERSVLDAALDVSGVNPANQAPAGSKFVVMSDLFDLSFSILGRTYTLSDHSPVVFTTEEGVIFNDDLSFRQFIDANIPGRPPSSSASFINFGTIGDRLLFNDTVANGFQIEGSDACPFVQPFSAACSFTVVQAEVPEPAVWLLYAGGLLGLALLRRRGSRLARA